MEFPSITAFKPTLEVNWDIQLWEVIILPFHSTMLHYPKINNIYFFPMHSDFQLPALTAPSPIVTEWTWLVTPHVYLLLSKLFRTFCPHVMQIHFCSPGSTPPLIPKSHPPPSPPPPPTPPSESLIESQLPWNKIGDWSGGNPVMQRRVGGREDRERWEGGDTDRWRDAGWQRDWEWEREHRTLRETR